MEAVDLFNMKQNVRSEPLAPLLKWPGGKSKEIKYIHPLLPKEFDRFFEPFVGGGAVYFSIDADEFLINDRSHELIDLYRLTAEQNVEFLDTLVKIDRNWEKIEDIVARNESQIINFYKAFSKGKVEDKAVPDWVGQFALEHADEFNGMFQQSFNVDIENFIKEIKRNSVSKIKRMKKIEMEKWELPDEDILDNFESSLKSAFYMHFRYLLNNIERLDIKRPKASAIFYFVRSYTYSGMFRYNSRGEFNVPYGGIGYNRKRLDKKIWYFKSDEIIEHLNKTVIECLDFEYFLKKHSPNSRDFIFLDPPYDSDFSTYAQNEFLKEDQKRLANYLINECEAKWMIVIKNTEFIHGLYAKDGIDIKSFDKNYLVSFQNRNDKSAEHLIIRNYR